MISTRVVLSKLPATQSHAINKELARLKHEHGQEWSSWLAVSAVCRMDISLLAGKHTFANAQGIL